MPLRPTWSVSLALVAGAAIAALVVACGGTTSVPLADAGASDDGGADSTVPSAIDAGYSAAIPLPDGAIAPKARAIVRMNGGAAAGCATVPTMLVGDFGDGTAGKPPRAIEDGATEDGKAVTVKCLVAPRGATIAVDATVTLADVTVTVTGALDATGKGSDVSFSLAKTARWSSRTCTLDTTVDPTNGVAPGRVWGSLVCGASTSDTGATCDIFGQIRLENCVQN